MRKCTACAAGHCGAGKPAERFVAVCMSDNASGTAGVGGRNGLTHFPNCTGREAGIVVFQPDEQDNACCDIYTSAWTEYEGHDLLFPVFYW